jgi:molybdate transport repressor ModE-like protein
MGRKTIRLYFVNKVTIRPQWSLTREGSGTLMPRLIELLRLVQQHGSLARACEASGLSYRHAWQMVREGHELFGAPLLRMSPGRNSTLAPLGEKLVWADHRIAARLTPLFESIASELEAEIAQAMQEPPAVLRLHASHGFSVEVLQQQLMADGMQLEWKYCTAIEAVSAMSSWQCDVAGVHVPHGEFEAAGVEHYRPWLRPGEQMLIDVSTRRQGLMLKAGNPLRIQGVADLARMDVRFVSRDPGSGTRLLLDLLLQQAGVDPAGPVGYAPWERTHAAVAAYVASGMADAGFGVETAARRFELDFIPLQTEQYFLLCDEAFFDTPAMLQLMAVLSSEEFRGAVNQLPGYDARHAGEVHRLEDAFPSLSVR